MKIESKNNLESLLYQFREAVSNEEIKNKITTEEVKQIEDVITNTETWLLDEHSKEEYDTKLTEINNSLNPIMMKIYQGENTEMPMPGSDSIPTVDEID